MTIADSAVSGMKARRNRKARKKKIKQLKGCSIDRKLLTGEGPPFPDSEAPKPRPPTLGNPVDIDEFVFVPRYDIQQRPDTGQLVGDEQPMFAKWRSDAIG